MTDNQMVYTRCESPKVVRERKSKERNFDGNRLSPKLVAKHQHDTSNLQKSIYTCTNLANSFKLKYKVHDQDFAKGAYGKILLASDLASGEKVVIKKIPRTTPIRMINNEVRAGKAIGSHPNIATLYEYIDEPDFHYLVFQFIQGQDLFTYLEKLNFAPRTETEARSTVSQILKALQHIHNRSIAHRDIKLENILIDANGKITVIDLGLCAFMEAEGKGRLCRDWCGSDNYLGPEIVRRTPYNGYLADVFSTGVVLFALLFGVFPFENLRVNGHNSASLALKVKVRFPSDVKVSNSAKDLLQRMLEDDPDKRITVKEVLEHEWIQGSDYDAMSMDSLRSSLKNSMEAAPAP